MPQEPDRKNPAPENFEGNTTGTISGRETTPQAKSPRNTRCRVPHSPWNNSFAPPLPAALARQIAYDPNGKLNQASHKNSLAAAFNLRNDPENAYYSLGPGGGATTSRPDCGPGSREKLQLPYLYI